MKVGGEVARSIRIIVEVKGNKANVSEEVVVHNVLAQHRTKFF